MKWVSFNQQIVGSSFWLMLYFCLMEEGEWKGKKERKNEIEIAVGEEGFPRAGPALLSMMRVTGIRCN
jgi:hypothetical protein